jgi:hypothetical protein
MMEVYVTGAAQGKKRTIQTNRKYPMKPGSKKHMKASVAVIDNA